MVEDELVLAIIKYLRTLAHDIRTPLSIISNDLSYLSSLVGDSETKRPIDKCRQISELLNQRITQLEGKGIDQLMLILNSEGPK